MAKFYSKKTVLTAAAVFSAIVRSVYFFWYLESPFRHFHKVTGLDMETLLRFSEWEQGREFSPLFVVHRFLIYLVWLFNGKEHCIPAVILIQNLAGIAGAVLVADLVLMLWGKRKTALCTGILYALYAPLMLYDCCILQESVTTFLILFAVWAYVKCKIRHYPSNLTFLSGLLLGLSSVGRPVAALLSVILPVKTFFDGKRKAAYLLAGGVCALWLAASCFNFVFSQSFFPFFKAMNYTMTFHAEKSGVSPETANTTAPKSDKAWQRFIFGLPQRTAQFFLAHEVPENINYYFLRDRIFPLKYLPGPGLLMPLALAGIFLMLTRIKKRESLLLFVILLLAFPLAAREPIGRYRLHLVPYFFLCGAYFFIVLQRNTKKSLILCASAYALALGINFAFSSPAYVRAADHVAWGKAIEAKNNGKPSRDSLSEFFRGWIKSNCSDRAAGVNLITSSLRANNMKLALQTIQDGIDGPAKEKSIYYYYKALILTSNRQFDAAEKELSKVNENEIPHLKKKIQILRRVVQRKSF